MMRPPPPARMCGTHARQQRNTPSVLTSITLRHSPASISSNGRSLSVLKIAALLTRMSMRPNAFHGFGRICSTLPSNRNIYFQAQRPRTGRLGILGRGGVVIAQVGDHHGRAVFREAHRQRLADAAARASDNGYFSFELHGFQTTCS